MGENQRNSARQSVRWLRVIGWSAALVLLQLSATWLLSRLQKGRLFLFALPWDAPAGSAEMMEAAASAKAYWWPAIVVVAVIWGLIAVCSEGGALTGLSSLLSSRVSWRLYLSLAIFLLGTIADLTTTFAFFHRDGVDQELHPGIRLVSYALGRSVGPIVTKLIQFFGVMLIAIRWPKTASYLFALAGIIYLAGAAYNLWISMS